MLEKWLPAYAFTVTLRVGSETSDEEQTFEEPPAKRSKKVVTEWRILKSPSQNGDSDTSPCAATDVATESGIGSNRNDLMEIEQTVERNGVESGEATTSSRDGHVKSEPIDSDLLLDDELRLQIEKSIEMVVNEYSLTGFNVDLSEPTSTPQMSQLPVSAPNVQPTENVTTSSCAKGIADLPPKIRNDITVIPLTNRVSSIKSEPKDVLTEYKRKLPNAKVDDNERSSNSYLSALSSGRHSSLTIVPVTTSIVTKPSASCAIIKNNFTSRNRNDSVEFSLTPDVTIKTVQARSTTSMTLNKVTSGQNFLPNCPPKACASVDSVTTPRCSTMPPIVDSLVTSRCSTMPPTVDSSATSRCSTLPPNPYNVPGTQPICYDSAMKHIIDSLPASVPCTSSFNSSSCLYSKPNIPISTTTSSSCSFPSSYSKSCSNSGPSVSALGQSQAVVPYNQNPSFCNFNYSQSASPLSSPKHLKPSINLNPCRMSSSPVPAYMRSKEYGNGAPLLCNIISDPLGGIIPPESSSFKATPPWIPGTPSFRSPTSPASLNFPLPSSVPPTSQSVSTFSPYNQTNALMVPNQKQNFNYRSSYPPFTPNSFQRSQCCFSSQIQCFNAGCASASQQQFSIVQHSTRLSNLKTNSMDGVSSLLQYHYFKKY